MFVILDKDESNLTRPVNSLTLLQHLLVNFSDLNLKYVVEIIISQCKENKRTSKKNLNIAKFRSLL